MSNEANGDHPDFRLKEHQDVLVITFAGPKFSFDMREDLYRLVEVDGHGKLILNLENVRVMTSAPIGVLVSLKKKAGLIGGSVILCQVDDDLQEILRITRVAQLFDFFDDEQSAIDSFSLV